MKCKKTRYATVGDIRRLLDGMPDSAPVVMHRTSEPEYIDVVRPGMFRRMGFAELSDAVIDPDYGNDMLRIGKTTSLGPDDQLLFIA